MNAQTCPNCGSRLMPFSEFFRNVEPGTVATCPKCDVQVQRSGAVWVLLVAALFLFAGFAVYLTRGEWTPFQILLAMLIAFPLWIVAVKLLGWVLVPWKLSRRGDRPVRRGES
jgi:hypothetical protein